MQQLCQNAMNIANKRKLHCPDFGLSSGRRSADEQFSLYKRGRKQDPVTTLWKVVNPAEVVTHCDGIVKRSVHQSGNAVDFFAYIDGAANYEAGNLALIATCFYEAASEMKLDIDWGGNFRSMSDAPHIEITKY